MSLRTTVFQMGIARVNGRLWVGLRPVPRPQPDLHRGFFAITAVNGNHAVRPNATRTNKVKFRATITYECFANATPRRPASDQIHNGVWIVLEIDCGVVKTSLFIAPR